VKIGILTQATSGCELTRSIPAYFDKCQSTEPAAARSIGVTTVEMIQNGILPEADKKLTLKQPERWSPEASNFLEVTSWRTLKDTEALLLA
jgi:hypothetical protein